MLEDINSKEALDALYMLLHCSLADKEFTTQKEQFEIVYKHIKQLEKYQQMWNELYAEKEMPCSIEYMQNLEEKYNIGKEQ